MASPVSFGRLYKSRKSRPCDACRRKKSACDMPQGPPCHRCSARSLSCTFDHGPGDRKRPRPPGESLSPSAPNNSSGYLLDNGLDTSFTTRPEGVHDLFLPQAGLPEMELSGISPVMNDLGSVSQQDYRFLQNDSSSAAPPRPVSAPPPRITTLPSSATSSNVSSLELIPSAFSFYVGPTGATDVHLLRRETFDENDMARPKLRGLRYRRIEQTTGITTDEAEGGSWAESPLIFGITDRSLLEKAEPKPNGSDIETAWSELWSIIEPKTAWQLIRLYDRFIDPSFPILSRQQLEVRPGEVSKMPLGLVAAICASALPFIVHDESLYGLLLHPPCSSRLYQICWLDISQNLHAPTLATLQACLLLLQRLPTNAYLSDTAFTWNLMSTSLAVAQTIGLHRDPTGWITVPLWERRLRKRLWWALWIMEKWTSLIRGMPSNINDDDFDVSQLTPGEEQGDGDGDRLSECLAPPPWRNQNELYHLASLTHILSDIQRTYYTVRATSNLSSNLALSLDLARAPKAALKSWISDAILMSSMPDLSTSPPPQFSGTNCSSPPQPQSWSARAGPLYLSYLVVQMTLFRALLRPLEHHHHQSPSEEEATYAIIIGSIRCATDFVAFAEDMHQQADDVFWHSWSRGAFAVAGNFMVQLLHVVAEIENVMTPGLGLRLDEAKEGAADSCWEQEVKALVRRWRMASRRAKGKGGRGLVELGLLRVESMLGGLVDG